MRNVLNNVLDAKLPSTDAEKVATILGVSAGIALAGWEGNGLIYDEATIGNHSTELAQLKTNIAGYQASRITLTHELQRVRLHADASLNHAVAAAEHRQVIVAHQARYDAVIEVGGVSLGILEAVAGGIAAVALVRRLRRISKHHPASA